LGVYHNGLTFARERFRNLSVTESFRRKRETAARNRIVSPLSATIRLPLFAARIRADARRERVPSQTKRKVPQ
jgi:hypothetical protein